MILKTCLNIFEKKVSNYLEIPKMFGLICFLELPNILFTKYKKVFNPKKCSYQVHPIEIIINFAPEMEEC